MLKKILEGITTVDHDGVTNIVNKESGQPGDRSDVTFKVGDLVMVSELKVGKVQSVKNDDVEVLHKDGTVTTAKMGDVTNIVVKE